MADRDATNLNNRQMHESSFGNAVVEYDEYVTSALANGDVVRMIRVPGGSRILNVELITDQVDSNGAPTVTCKAGYAPVNSADGPAAVDDYFLAAGSTILRTAGTTVTPSKARPLKIAYDIFITMTITAAIATLVTTAKIGVRVTREGLGR